MTVKTFIQAHKGGCLVWGLVGGVFAYTFIAKHGPALAYFKAAPFWWAGVTVALSIYGSNKLHAYLLGRNARATSTRWIDRAKGAAFAVLLAGQGYLYFGLSPDRHVLAALVGVQVEVLSPCAHTLSPENEQLALAFFKHDRPSFDCY